MNLSKFHRGRSAQHFSFTILLLLVISFFLDGYYTSLLSKAIIFTIFAISLDLAWGYGGILSLGHSVFFGLGAYGYSIIALSGVSSGKLVLAVFIGLLMPLLFALLLSSFLFYSKSSAFYIGIVTLSSAVLMEQFALQLSGLTGGQNGLTNIPGFPFQGQTLFLFLLFMLILVFAVAYKFTRSDLGRLIVSTRDNEERTMFLGYNTSMSKTILFTLSGGIAGLAGVLYAPFDQFVSPSMLSFTLATQVIIWVAIGGRGRLVGAVMGALTINILSPVFNDYFPYIWQIFLGLAFIVVVIFLPKGLYSLLDNRWGVLENFQLQSTKTKQVNERNGEDTLNIADLYMAYGSLAILKGVSFPLKSGEITCVVGPNGAGKSTLINSITGKTAFQKGSILYNHTELKSASVQSIVQSGIARTFQATNVIDSLSVGENLKLARGKGELPSFYKRSHDLELTEEVMELLKQSGLDKKLSTIAGELSHGEQQALELCMVLSLEPRFLLLDEPTAGLTIQERKEIGNMLQSLAHDKGLSVLIIEHDLDFVKEIADRVIVLYDGKIVEDGSVEEVTNSSLVKEIYLGVNAL